jgi:hypothetical protein
MTKQKDINEKMRAILIDWLITVNIFIYLKLIYLLIILIRSILNLN